MKKTIMAVLAAMALLFVPIQATAGDYQYVGLDDELIRLAEIDTISKQTNTGYVRMWHAIGWAGYQDDNIYLMRVFSEYDCKARRSRLLSFSSYNLNGKLLFSDTKTGDWEYSIPDTYGEGTLQVACREVPQDPERIMYDGDLLTLIHAYRDLAAEGGL